MENNWSGQPVENNVVSHDGHQEFVENTLNHMFQGSLKLSQTMQTIGYIKISEQRQATFFGLTN